MMNLVKMIKLMKIMKLELTMQENIEKGLEDRMHEYINNTDGIG